MRKYKEELKAHIVYSIFLYHLGSSHQKSVSFSSGVVRDWTLFLYKLLFSQGPMIQDMLTFNVHTRERQPYPPDRMWYKRASTLKLLDAVYHSALRFSTGDVYSTHHCNLYKKKIKKKLCGPLSSLCLSVCLSICKMWCWFVFPFLERCHLLPLGSTEPRTVRWPAVIVSSLSLCWARWIYF